MSEDHFSCCTYQPTDHFRLIVAMGLFLSNGCTTTQGTYRYAESNKFFIHLLELRLKLFSEFTDSIHVLCTELTWCSTLCIFPNFYGNF